MVRTAEVVIIGGGIVGASIGHYLTQQGCAGVVILERECVPGLGSTGRASGGFRTQFSTPINVQLSLRALELLRTFEDATGIDPQYQPNGYLFLATSGEQLQWLERLVAMQHGEGLFESRMVSPENIRTMIPAVFVEDVCGGSFCPLDGFLEPLHLLHGFLTQAMRRGAALQTETEVVGFEVKRGAISAVRTTRETIETRCVVNAAGAWAKRVAAMAEVDLPVEPLRRHVACTLPLPELPDATPMVVELESSFHFRKDQSSGGVMLLWNNDDEPFGENTVFDNRWLARLLPTACRRLPCLAQARISARRSWAGLYAMSPDHHAVLGTVPGVEGLYLANGFSGHGVMHAPATGQLMAELVLNGHTGSFDISALGIERFAGGKLLREEGVL